jgi:D-alanine-D-alanine ligase
MVWKSDKHLRVAVLEGGDSSEREISLLSGAQVASALRSAGHCVQSVDPAMVDLEQADLKNRFDVCFLALHGGAGEDGRIQQWLEERQIPYTGSNPQASRAAMDKSTAKTLFQQHDIPTPEFLLIDPSDSIDEIARCVTTLGFPLVIKPNSQGSSLGVGLAECAEVLPDRVTQTRQYEDWVLVERYIAGREFTVSVLGRKALPLLEIAGLEKIFDFGSKYSSEVIQCRFQTGLAPMKVQEVQQMAVAAAAALRTSGLVRVDLRLDTEDQPWVLEVNTLPGMTDHSLAPKAAAQAGIDLPSLCDWMLQDALRK